MNRYIQKKEKSYHLVADSTENGPMAKKMLLSSQLWRTDERADYALSCVRKTAVGTSALSCEWITYMLLSWPAWFEWRRKHHLPNPTPELNPKIRCVNKSISTVVELFSRENPQGNPRKAKLNWSNQLEVKRNKTAVFLDLDRMSVVNETGHARGGAANTPFFWKKECRIF